MKIETAFTVPAPPDTAYRFLLDLERVAPCIPGGELGAPVGDGSYPARVTVKLGPMRLGYDGTLRIAERDDAARTAVLSAHARETRGSGSVQATMEMAVAAADGAGSSVAVTTELQLTGRAAQMGRGVVEDVARKLVDELAACLAARLSAGGDEAGDEAPAAGPARPVSALFLVRGLLRSRISTLLHRRKGHG